MKKNKKSQIYKQMIEITKDRMVADIINITSQINKDKYIKPKEEMFDNRYRASTQDSLVCLKNNTAILETFIPAGIMNSEETDYFCADLINLSELMLLEILEMLEDKKYTIVNKEAIKKEGYGLFDKIEETLNFDKIGEILNQGWNPDWNNTNSI